MCRQNELIFTHTKICIFLSFIFSTYLSDFIFSLTYTFIYICAYKDIHTYNSQTNSKGWYMNISTFIKDEQMNDFLCLSVCLYLSIYLSLSISLSLCLLLYISIFLSLYFSFSLSLYIYISLSLSLTIFLSFFLFLFLFLLTYMHTYTHTIPKRTQRVGGYI